MAGQTNNLGRSALASAVPWLASGAAILLILYLAQKQLGPGGLSAWLKKLLGLGPTPKTSEDTNTQQDSAGQDHQSSGVGSAAVTGHFAIASGDTVPLDVNMFGLFKSTVSIPFDLVNSSNQAHTVLVQIHSYADYLLSDQAQTWEQLVEVAPLSGKHVEATLELTNIFSTIPTTRPTLFLDLTVAGVHQARIEGVRPE